MIFLAVYKYNCRECGTEFSHDEYDFDEPECPECQCNDLDCISQGSLDGIVYNITT
jgi:Zn finger protein HypA/HybF involved in hydrogenase expression